ncbi:MAG: asparagine synthase (glutamine-hydrolyzing) [Acidobacteriota bacterium]|nr:asparagine synthase (glutamine-hydrolyzing) [Acidobacteriota bacterium]
MGRKLVMSLTAALAHRGPDAEGAWFSPDGRAGLGHRRLSILDLSPSGRQPMVSADGRFVITFNGEIYNFLSLREEMERDGERFSTGTDTEVLLRLWAMRGVGCLSLLRGMYAFAVWDDLERRLWLVRDPMGIKPLFYAHEAGALTFASEAKALRKAGLGGGISPAGAGAFLRWGSIPAPLTIFEGIHALPPASWLSWDEADGKIRIETYWDFNSAWAKSKALVGEVATREQAVEWTRDALRESVRAHLVSDVPVGAFLSGGIDSTAVVSFMRQAGQREIKTFSIGMEDAALDETRYARQAAERYGTEHHEWRISAADYARLRPEFFSALDQPTVDGFNTFLVSKLAHDHGMKVVTSGVGGDEIFRGYEMTFKNVPALGRVLRRVPKAVRGTGAGALRRRPLRKLLRKPGRYVSLLRAEPQLAHLYLWSRELFTADEVRGLFARSDFADEAARVDMAQFLPDYEADNISRQAEISILEARRYLASQLLSDSDSFSMAHSLELRVPLVDRTLYEQLIAINDEFFLDGDSTPKALLVAATGDLPEQLVRRSKQGFTLPFQNWLGGGDDPRRCLSPMLRSPLTEKISAEVRRNRRHWSAWWAIQILENFFVSNPA